MPNTYDANSSYFDDGISNFDAALNFDAGSTNSVVKIRQVNNQISQSYIAGELGVVRIKTAYVGIENYSNYVDLMKYVPEKFRSSVVLQQFLAEAGLLTGEWLGDINDLSLLIDKYNVNQQFITYLADLIGFSFHTTPSTTFPQIQRQLIQAIDWYKIKGTYQAYQYIGYVLGLSLNCYDLYTQDYINFIQESWYAGAIGSLPPDVALTNPPFVTTSTTSLTISIGSKTLTVGTGLTFAASQNISITNSTGNYMLGTLTSYNSGTGVMVVNVTAIFGSGTYTSWSVPGGYYKSPHFGVQASLTQIYNYSANQLYNWTFGSWSSGINNPPDAWTFTTNYSTGVQGIGGNEVVQSTSQVEIAPFSAKLIANQVGYASYIYQDIETKTGMGAWLGQTVTFGCWVWAPTAATQVSIYIDDGVTQTPSTTHPADNSWHFLTVTKVISNSATIIRCYIKNYAATISVSAYVDGATFVLGSSIPLVPTINNPYPGPDLWYLFDGTNTFGLLTAYINGVRPVNTVPQYGLTLTAQAKENNGTTTLLGNVQTATIGSTWGSNQDYFNDGTSSFDNSLFFDFAATSFYNSITTYKLGTGNKGVNPSNSGFALQNVVITGAVANPQIFADHITYTIKPPSTTTQAGLSELGLYLSDGTTLEIGCTFPSINIVSGLGLTIYVNIYF